MKKTFATAFLTLATVCGFAQDAVPEQNLTAAALPLEVKPSLPVEEKSSAKKSFTYLRMGIADSQPVNTIDNVNIVPGLGIGYRYMLGASAIDVSASYSQRPTAAAEGQQQAHFYTAPKVNYLYYVGNLYLGGGVAWGGLVTKDQREFTGAVSNASLGYEFTRTAAVRTFAQLDVSQPIPGAALTQVGDFPGPFAEFSVGVGF